MKSAVELSEVIDQFLPRLADNQLPWYHYNTLMAIRNCRTAKLGAHIDACDACGHLRISYNSCRNRHCPKCQGIKKEMWTIQQEDQLLPCSYFHVVFTIPHQLNELCLRNPRFMYSLLFQAAWFTINTFARDPKWLGAKSAATMVLHTWSQTLMLHPHIHCIVPNGGLNDKGEWQNPKKGNSRFLYPVAAMRKVFKAFFLKQMKASLEQGLLVLPSDFPFQKHSYQLWKEALYEKQWVVFTKKPFGGVRNVVNYLARYSHRVAITNHRLVSIDNDKVSFQYKDYADKAKKKVMALDGVTFIKRFCLHILPKRFGKVRHTGFLANACKAKDLHQARTALNIKQKELLDRAQRKKLAIKRLFPINEDTCPCCKKGKMIEIYKHTPNKDPPAFVKTILA